jgi:hypothetical protein
MHGEQLAPLLPGLAALQRDGVVSAAKVQIVERAIHTLSRPSLDPQAVETAEQLLTDQAAILAPAELHKVRPRPSSPPPTPTARNRSMTNCNTTGAISNSTSGGTACGSCTAGSATPSVPN